ncbi:glycosyltransferase family 2 protein [Methylocystis parvus]|uniref:Glycosyltransferase family 2 protein n=1 Tax=Methylocystis parvus TaxID=134 RepID=A0A6B8M998_9HYPH|nr:glycosyltransferase [Methylocystis parvus]QGM99236.1 glycosyltransferase family 2 protein [Methylocystis parvus]WBK00383.1 glycosyltransferase family 2 protein [Methylocystis parvus OBBP]
MPAVSVVIPHFNRLNTLPRALRSVAAQSFRDIEMIIVDDASSDDPGPIVRAMSPPFPVTILRQETNTGPARCRNIGVAEAKGRWIAFLDSDDEWLSEKIATQVAAAEHAGDKGRVVCVAKTFIRWPDREEERALWNPDDGPIGAFFFLQGGVMQTSSLLLSRELALAAPFDERLRQFEDIWFLIQLAEQGASFQFQHERLFYWYRGASEAQLSRAISIASARTFMELCGPAIGNREKRAFLTMMAGPAWVRKAPLEFWPAAIGALLDGSISFRNLAGIIRKSRSVRLLP